MKNALRVCALLCCTAGMLLIAGCSASKQEQKDDSVVLKVYTYADLSEAGADSDETAIWKRFDELHPDIKVVRENSTNEAYHQKLAAYVASGNIPDVMYLAERKVGGNPEPAHGKGYYALFKRAGLG